MKLTCRHCQYVLGAQRQMVENCWSRWWRCIRTDPKLCGRSNQEYHLAGKQPNQEVGFLYFVVFIFPPHLPRVQFLSPPVFAEVSQHYWSSLQRCDHTHSWVSLGANQPCARESRLVNKSGSTPSQLLCWTDVYLSVILPSLENFLQQKGVKTIKISI